MIRVWNLATGQPVGLPVDLLPADQFIDTSQDRVRATAVAHVDGRILVLAGVRKETWAWTLEDVRPIRLTTHDLAHEPDIAVSIGVCDLHGTQAAVLATWRGGCTVWDLSTGAAMPTTFVPEPKYVHSMVIIQGEGTPTAIFAATVGPEGQTGPGVLAYEVSTGLPSQKPHPGHPHAISLAAVDHDGRTLVISSVITGVINVWDSRSDTRPPVQEPILWSLMPDDPAAIRVPGDITTLAAIGLDGGPVAVYSGRSGVVRVVDLTRPNDDRELADRILSLAIGSLNDHLVVVCGSDKGAHILDLDSGEQVRPPAGIPLDGRQVTAVAATELHGRPVAVCAAQGTIRAWYLDNGEPTTMQPIEHRSSGYGRDALTVAMVGNRPAVISGGADRTIRVNDLATGLPVCHPLADLGDTITGVGIATVHDRDVLVYARPGGVNSRYLLTIDEEEAARHSCDDMTGRTRASLDETPARPPRIGERLTGDGFGQIAIAVGAIDGTPVVVSGRDTGAIDIYTIDTALPVGQRFTCHTAPITAVAFGQIHGRYVIVSGSTNGTVVVWDLAARRSITTVHTLARVQTLAFRNDGRCVIGTEKGMAAIHLPAIDDADGHAVITMPFDVAAARRCPQHKQHTEMVDVNGRSVLRVCIKGIQLGHPRYDSLQYAGGHCFVLPDRLVITGPIPASEQPPKLELMYRHVYFKREDTPHAYQYDGCHFGITIGGDAHRTLCCYTRADREQLYAAIPDHFG
jgi:WD40 repeat protein